jgi:hypothetical protein
MIVRSSAVGTLEPGDANDRLPARAGYTAANLMGAT